MASEMSIASGVFTHFPLMIPTHLDFCECIQLCEFSPMYKSLTHDLMHVTHDILNGSHQ